MHIWHDPLVVVVVVVVVVVIVVDFFFHNGSVSRCLQGASYLTLMPMLFSKPSPKVSSAGLVVDVHMRHT